MKKVSLGTVLCVFLSLITSEEAAWGYGATHRLLNESIYDVSQLDEYFSVELGVALDSRGRIAQKYFGNSPFELFRIAGIAEDDPWQRTLNHFHDPLRGWEQSGYTKLLSPDGISNILWAQYGLVQNHEWLSGPNDEWNWQQAYAYFLSGLSS